MLILPSKTILSAAARKKSGGGGPSDPSFANVSLLLHMNGANDSTVFTDNSSNALAMTANGGAKISTANSKFGGASGLFNGSSTRVTTGSSAALDLGTGDFTIELWINPSTVGTAQTTYISSISGSISTGMQFTYVSNSFRIGKINDSSQSSVVGTPTLNVWQHIAVTRSSGVVRFFKDGIQLGSNSNNTNSYDLGLGGTTVGNLSTFGSTYFNGYMDDLRVTKGVARYTANFTPPTAQFPDS